MQRKLSNPHHCCHRVLQKLRSLCSDCELACDDVDVMFGIEHLSQGEQVRVLPNNVHHSHFLVHQVEVFFAGVSADNLNSHSLRRLLVPSEHDVSIGSTASVRYLGFWLESVMCFLE